MHPKEEAMVFNSTFIQSGGAIRVTGDLSGLARNVGGVVATDEEGREFVLSPIHAVRACREKNAQTHMQPNKCQREWRHADIQEHTYPVAMDNTSITTHQIVG